MIQIIHRLRIARLLAVLAVLLTVGIGPHLHAATGGEQLGTIICTDMSGPTGNAGDTDHPSATHCGVCHAVRALLPTGGAQAGMVAAQRLPRLASELPAGLPAPDVPARPPRLGTA